MSSPIIYYLMKIVVIYFLFRFLDTKYISSTEPLKDYFPSTILNDLNKSLAEQCQNYTILGKLFIYQNVIYLFVFYLK